MKRKPDYQPYADAIPVLVPRSGVWWRRIISLLRTWFGAFLVLLLINALIVFNQAQTLSPRGLAAKLTEMLVVKQVNAQRTAGASDGAALTKLNAEVLSLKSENAALSSLVERSANSSFGFVSLSKVRSDGGKIYWQALVKSGSKAKQGYILDVRSVKEQVVQGVMPNSRSIMPNSAGDLFDGYVPAMPYLQVSLWDRSTKMVVQTIVVSLGEK